MPLSRIALKINCQPKKPPSCLRVFRRHADRSRQVATSRPYVNRSRHAVSQGATDLIARRSCGEI